MCKMIDEKLTAMTDDLIGNDNGLLRCFDRWGAPA